MENKMKDVAKLLGLELEEEFKTRDLDDIKYKWTNSGLVQWVDTIQEWVISLDFNRILTGDVQIIKLPILDDVEKEYLSSVIRPFRNRVIYIAKGETVKTYSPNAKIYECIYIMYKDSSKKQNPFYMGFPCFEKGTMYKGMELDKKYTLKELGL